MFIKPFAVKKECFSLPDPYFLLTLHHVFAKAGACGLCRMMYLLCVMGERMRCGMLL